MYIEKAKQQNGKKNFEWGKEIRLQEQSKHRKNFFSAVHVQLHQNEYPFFALFAIDL